MVETHLTPEGIRIPEYLAIFAIIFFLTFNLISIDVLIHEHTGVHIILSSHQVALVIYAFILTGLFLLFLRKKRYLSIVAKHENENPLAKGISIVLTLAYAVFSVVLLIIVTSGGE